MRTVKEWLNTLPEPYRAKALHNHIGYKGKFGYAGTLEIALILGFKWSSTVQGRAYWTKVAQMAKIGDYGRTYKPKPKTRTKRKKLVADMIKKTKASVEYPSLDKALQDHFKHESKD